MGEASERMETGVGANLRPSCRYPKFMVFMFQVQSRISPSKSNHTIAYLFEKTKSTASVGVCRGYTDESRRLELLYLLSKLKSGGALTLLNLRTGTNARAICRLLSHQSAMLKPKTQHYLTLYTLLDDLGAEPLDYRTPRSFQY